MSQSVMYGRMACVSNMRQIDGWCKALLIVVILASGSIPASRAGEPPAKPATPPKWKPAELRQFVLTHPGNPQAGKRLFSEPKILRCAACHRVNGKGEEVGPDLSQIGGKFDRPHLIESILEPSRQIVEGYRTTTILTSDGKTWSGIVRDESKDGLVLVEATGQRRRIAKKDIEQRAYSQVSLMPEGLVNELTPEQFTDLIAYLEGLHSGGNATPGTGITGPVTLPPGFTIQVIATGLTGCTALEAAPDGRVFVCEQTGALRVVKNDRLLDAPVMRLDVDSSWERGLIGVTVDPAFPRRPYVYVCYVAAKPYPHHRVSRWTVVNDRAVPGSEKVLLEGDDQNRLGGSVPNGHQGGALHFGVDGKLYIAIGDQTAGAPAQDLSTFQGKLLRINADGTIPADNPFVKKTKGKYRSAWAIGLRNPFAFAVQPRTGRIFINDVGGNYEEINEGTAGANFGWPSVEHGPTSDARFRGPIHWYPAASIVGGAFAPPDLHWPGEYRGYFFLDFVGGWIKVLDPDKPARARTLATGLRRPTDLRFAPDGSLYVLVRNAWVIDREFRPGTGSLLKIQTQARNKTGVAS
jgi:putative heme-binding domain-containing protein